MAGAIQYARSGDLHIAYQVVGDGPLDLVWVQGWVSHLELMWEQPEYAAFLRRLAAFSRLILFDKRGTGLSDSVRTDELPTLEERMDDVRAVLDAVGSERAVLFGTSEGGPMCALFAATYPDRTSALVMYGPYARFLSDPPDYPWGWPADDVEDFIRLIEDSWGGTRNLLTLWAPDRAGDPAAVSWFNRYLRMSASPATAAALTRMNVSIDVRDVLPAVKVPTLVVHRSGDRLVEPGHGRFVASQIPDARLVELEDENHLWFWRDPSRSSPRSRSSLPGCVRPPSWTGSSRDGALHRHRRLDRTSAAELGDQRWRDLLGAHHDRVRRELERFRGREIDTAGDGVLAAFDGPARAVRCAWEIPAGGAPRSSGSSSGREFTPASANGSAQRSPVSRFTRAHVSRPWPARGRSSCRARSRTSWRDRDSASERGEHEGQGRARPLAALRGRGSTPRVRVAAIYDVHGNLPALEAALAADRRARVDLIVVGGDSAWATCPATMERLRRSATVPASSRRRRPRCRRSLAEEPDPDDETEAKPLVRRGAERRAAGVPEPHQRRCRSRSTGWADAFLPRVAPKRQGPDHGGDPGREALARLDGSVSASLSAATRTPSSTGGSATTAWSTPQRRASSASAAPTGPSSAQTSTSAGPSTTYDDAVARILAEPGPPRDVRRSAVDPPPAITAVERWGDLTP